MSHATNSPEHCPISRLLAKTFESGGTEEEGVALQDTHGPPALDRPDL
jgi:hypothetical protein